jgi:hypothetical protein
MPACFKHHCLYLLKAVRNAILVVVCLVAFKVAQGQTLMDLGSTAPVPGPNDISQLSTNGNQRLTGSFNYYTDNSNPPGQTFITGTNPLVLISLSLKTGASPLDSGNGGLGPQPFQLRIFSVSGGAAALINSYTSLASFSYADGDWLRWTNLAVPLLTNTTYAYTFCRVSNGYDGLAVTSSNYYGGGEAALIPSAGGAITFEGSHGFDAVFNLGLATNTTQILAGAPVVSPENTVYVGSPITLRSPAVGTPPLYHQWQTDGGGGGSLTNIPYATNSSVMVTPAITGAFKFKFVVTNSSGSATSSVAVVTVLPPVNVSVDVTKLMATMPFQGLGVNTATWDGGLINSTVPARLKAAGITALRYPGGSYADAFNWQTTTMNGGAYIWTVDSFDNWMNQVVNPSGAQAIITVNYGSNPANNAGGDTNVAAAWVDYANNTRHWGIKYWEIGNEIGGNGYYGTTQNWEYDLHYPETNAATRVGQPALSPAAYGSNSVQFIQAMKAKDPTIKCGVGFDTGNSSYNTFVLSQAGTNVDFVIIHWYPGGDANALLASTGTISNLVKQTYIQLTNNVGATHASQMQIAVTETGAGNVTGAAVSLFTADDFLTWIEDGAVNVDYQSLHNDILQADQTPGHAYYGAQMARLLANTNDVMLKTTSSQVLLRVHAAIRQDGKTGVMLINTDPILTIPVIMSINGPALAATGTSYQFGSTNFVGANDYPTYSVSSNNVSGLGNSFAVSVPPYTIVDLLIPAAPGNTPPVLAAIGSQTVNVGQTVAFTASATDTNLPAQTLTFSLLNGPGNAALNTNSGAFAWRPWATQADSTNLFSLKVVDNGTPSLSATQSFTVTVNPLTPPSVSSATWNNGSLALQVSGQAGPDYAVQVSTNLVDWNTLFITNFPPMPFQWVDTNAANLPAQFYRVKAGPPLP